jgi:hypothetical protein
MWSRTGLLSCCMYLLFYFVFVKILLKYRFLLWNCVGYDTRFYVVTVVSMKIPALLHMTLSQFVHSYWHVGEACCTHVLRLCCQEGLLFLDLAVQVFMLDITLSFSPLPCLLNVRLQSKIFYICFLGSLIVSLHNKFHIPGSVTSIGFTIKPKSKERFYMAITLFYIL